MTDDARYSFELDEQGGVRITHCEPLAREIAIPEHISGKPVTALGNSSFARMKHVTSVVCPPNVRSIGQHAFEQCRCLKRIVFPASLDVFDIDWLIGCRHLEEVTLPGRVESVSSNLFNVFPIRKLEIGAGTREIELPRTKPLMLDWLYIDTENRSLASDGLGIYSDEGKRFVGLLKQCESYWIDDRCTEIGSRAFAYRPEITRIVLPSKLEAIGDLAFFGCGIRSFEAPPALKSIGRRAFMGCSNLESAQLNEGLLAIGEGAFARTDKLGELALPSTVTELGASFAGFPEELAHNSIQISIDEGNEHLLVDDAYLVYRKETSGLTLADASCFTGREARLDPRTTRIADNAFSHHRFAENVFVPEGVVDIGDSAFSDSLKLKSVHLPYSLERIGDYAFFGTSLEYVHLPAKLTHIGARALDTTARRDWAFLNHTKKISYSTMRSITVDENNPNFYVRGGLLCRRTEGGAAEAVVYAGPDDHVIVPEEVTRIEAYALSGVTRVRKLELHPRVNSLGVAAFLPTFAYEHVIINLAEPELGQDFVDVNLPSDETGMNVIRNAFYSGVNPRILMESYDATLPHFPNLFERYRRMLERLANPVFLAFWAKNIYERDIAQNNRRVCRILAQNNYLRGIDQLVEFGFVDADDLSTVIDEFAGNPLTVAAVVRLIELKHRHFGKAAFDFAL